MGDIIPNTTALQSNDGTNQLLAKILHRLNLNAAGQVDVPAANVAVTNTPLPIDFDGPQPVTVENQPTVEVNNFPATQPVSGTVDIGTMPAVAVSNLPASQNVVVTNTPNVDAGIDFTDDGHTVSVGVPFEFEVSHSGFYREGGVNKVAKLFHVLGKRAGFNSTSVLQDVGEFLGTTTDTLPNLTGLESLELVSSSAQDDPSPAGTGTHSVRITYLTPAYVVAFVDYALNGTAAVAVAEKMIFVYGMEALTGGSGEVSAGNIDLRIAGGGAVHERITAGGNKSLSGRFMVPDNYNAYLSNWSASAIGTTMDVRLRATVRTYDRGLNDRYLFQDTAYLGAGQAVNNDIEWLKYPARSKFKVSVLPGAAAIQNRVDVSLCVILVQD